MVRINGAYVSALESSQTSGEEQDFLEMTDYNTTRNNHKTYIYRKVVNNSNLVTYP